MFELFFKGSNKIRVEGLNLNQFLSDCLNAGIDLSGVKKRDDFTLECTVPKAQYDRLMNKKFIKQYRISLLNIIGLPFYRHKAKKKKGFVIGLFIFLYLVYYQSQFITEIKIMGNENISNSDLKQTLIEMGITEGNKKVEGIDKIKKYLYMKHDDLAWVGIEYQGNKLVIDIVEKTKSPEMISYDIPCDIIAKKNGYIEKVVRKYGTAMVKKGEYVKEGDLLISGMVSDETGEIKYVHSLGEIYAKIIYRFKILEAKEEIIKNETGKEAYGLRVKIGDMDIEAGSQFVSFDRYNRQDSEIFKTLIPFPAEFCVIKFNELDVQKRIRTQKEIENSISQKVMHIIKKNIPENAEIINKDLMYQEENNIIRISVMIEALEQIGEEIKTMPVY